MTLVLTQLSRHGIAMAADSAVTSNVPLPGGGTTHRVLHGVQKLQMVMHIEAGISCWGMGMINGTPTDIWIRDFIQRYQATTPDLQIFTATLADELNNIFHPVLLIVDFMSLVLFKHRLESCPLSIMFIMEQVNIILELIQTYSMLISICPLLFIPLVNLG